MLSGVRTVQDPARLVHWITNEDVLLSMRGQASSLILLDMHISSAAKGAKVINRGLGFMPCFVGSAGAKCRSGGAVPGMYKGGQSEAPGGRLDSRSKDVVPSPID